MPRPPQTGSTQWRMLSLQIDYNHLESAFLVTAVGVLVAGMVFASRGFDPQTIGYNVVNVITAVLILGSSVAFLTLLSFEIYRSIKFAAIHEVGSPCLTVCGWGWCLCARQVCVVP